MPNQLISYDLRRPGQDYSELFAAIKSIGNWWHCLDSTWIVRTTLPSTEVRKRLTAHVDANDKVLVTALAGDWASLSLDKQGNDWLRQNV